MLWRLLGNLFIKLVVYYEIINFKYRGQQEQLCDIWKGTGLYKWDMKRHAMCGWVKVLES